MENENKEEVKLTKAKDALMKLKELNLARLSAQADVFMDIIRSNELAEHSDLKYSICDAINNISQIEFKRYEGQAISPEELESCKDSQEKCIKILNNIFNDCEQKITEIVDKTDFYTEALFVAITIIVTAGAILTAAGPAVLAASCVGLVLGVLDITFRLPNDVHKLHKKNDEYKSKSATEKIIFITNEIKNDKVKLGASIVSLTGGILLFAVLFSPALISAAPVLIPVTIGCVALACLVGATKKYLESDGEQKNIEKEVNKWETLGEKIESNINSFQNNIKEAYKHKQTIDKNTVVEKEKKFKKDLGDQQTVKKTINKERFSESDAREKNENEKPNTKPTTNRNTFHL